MKDEQVILASIPQYDALMWPTLVVLKRLGGSGRNQEILTAVCRYCGFSEEQ